MEYYYKPLDQAYDRNSIVSIIGVDPQNMDEETLMGHHLYPVEDLDRDPYLLSAGVYSYEVRGPKAYRSVIETPMELSDAKRIAKTAVLEGFSSDIERVLSNSGISSSFLLALSFLPNHPVKEVLQDQLNSVQTYIGKIAEAIVQIDEAQDFSSVKQIVTSACKRN